MIGINFFIILFSLNIFFNCRVSSQTIQKILSLNIHKTSNIISSDYKFSNNNSSSSSLNTLKIVTLLFPLNPIFLIENEKFYVGITKEISVGVFPFGRAAAEYSLIFRNTNVNQLRFSYNFDFPLESSDFALIFLSAGGGYFTDFNKQGIFPQLSASILVPATDLASVNLYFKLRNTFIQKDNGSDIFDISLGLSTVFYL